LRIWFNIEFNTAQKAIRKMTKAILRSGSPDAAAGDRRKFTGMRSSPVSAPAAVLVA
jgi:hypothetical protein